MPPKQDLTDCVYEKLTVLYATPDHSHGRRRYWRCLCECGDVIDVLELSLQNGDIKSCRSRSHRNQIKTSGDKWCTNCKLQKSIVEFTSDKTKNDGLSSNCKECHAKASQRLYQHNKSMQDPRYMIKRRLKQIRVRANKENHSPCVPDTEEILRRFRTTCEGCGREAGTKICMDHCHNTGRFRGFLCRDCNCALGFVKDSEEILHKLINYLRRGDATLS